MVHRSRVLLASGMKTGQNIVIKNEGMCVCSCACVCVYVYEE